jgi:alkanesulfonate monooxygenase SsuD/methylene tetrahydromethanopterin reductase-like flavin-dependent oxidoreductase (luciferase family)
MPYTPEREHRVYQEALDQVELADRLGYHAVWAVEHHFMEQYAHMSSPEVFLAACSQRTKQMRLGHGIMHAVPAINHPFRVAERIATLDLISSGRVEFGSGEGASLAELGAFGIDKDAKREMWAEGIDFAIKAMTETPFAGYEGKYVSAPPRNVVPKPYQQPHPPLWVATSRRETIERAAQLGVGALGFFFVEPEAARDWVEHYFRTFAEEAVPIGQAANPSFALNILCFAAQTREQATERFADSVEYFGFGSSHYYRDGEHFPGKSNLYDAFDAVKQANTVQEPNADEVADESLPRPIGTTEDVANTLALYEEIGVDEVLLMPQVGFTADHEHIMESIELIGKEVLPDFHRRHELDAPQREERKAQMREAAMARKPDEQRQAPADYSFGVMDTGMKRALDELYAVVAGEAHESRPQTPATSRGSA